MFTHSNESVPPPTPTQTIPNHYYVSPVSEVLALFIPPLFSLAPHLPHSCVPPYFSHHCIIHYNVL